PASEATWTRTRPADDLGAEYAVTVDARVERDSRGQDRLVVEVTCSALVFTGPEIEALVRSVEATVCERAARSGRVHSGHVRS
nr:hypothetical protein [Gordonia sp. (in: high G+C Gram-positive bacteria)]